jgi:hypothetical protein
VKGWFTIIVNTEEELVEQLVKRWREVTTCLYAICLTQAISPYSYPVYVNPGDERGPPSTAEIEYWKKLYEERLLSVKEIKYLTGWKENTIRRYLRGVNTQMRRGRRRIEEDSILKYSRGIFSHANLLLNDLVMVIGYTNATAMLTGLKNRVEDGEKLRKEFYTQVIDYFLRVRSFDRQKRQEILAMLC